MSKHYNTEKIHSSLNPIIRTVPKHTGTHINKKLRQKPEINRIEADYFNRIKISGKLFPYSNLKNPVLHLKDYDEYIYDRVLQPKSMKNIVHLDM